MRAAVRPVPFSSIVLTPRAIIDLGDDVAKWTRNGFSESSAWLWTLAQGDSVERIEYDAVSEAEFIERYEKPNVPVVIVGATKDWPANEAWTIDVNKKKTIIIFFHRVIKKNLVASYGDRRFRCGEDDSGSSVNLKMKYFLTYCAETKDDSPLYIFDGTFGDRAKAQTLLNFYSVPKYFREDLFQYMGESRRPPYRWVVIGPARSGTNIHIDPLGTSAWNSLLQGHKRWAIFPPGAPKELVSPPLKEDEAIFWFHHVYPLTQVFISFFLKKIIFFLFFFRNPIGLDQSRSTCSRDPARLCLCPAAGGTSSSTWT